MAYPSPTADQIRAAFDKHGVRYVVEPLRARSAGRPWSLGLRAMVDHHTAGRDSLAYMMNSGGEIPFVNALISREGLCHVLTWMSAWGSGNGGPWPGIAQKDALNLVGWQTEVEDIGMGQTFMAAQLATLGKVNAALVSLGVPPENEINHRDWTDGTGGVGGYPLPTVGRKVDTRYDTDILRANTARYAIRVSPPLLSTPMEDNDMLLITPVGSNAVYLIVGNQASLIASPADLAALRAAGVKLVELTAETVDALIAAKD